MSKKQSPKKGGNAKKQVKKSAKPVAKKAIKTVKKAVKKVAEKKKAKPAKGKTVKKPAPKKASASKPVKKAKPAAKKVLKKISKPVAKAAKKIVKVVKTVAAKSKPALKKLEETIIPTRKEAQLSMFQNTNVPKSAKKIEEDMSKDERTRYSDEELKEFEVLISDKLDKAKKELNYIKEALSKKNDTGTDTTGGTLKLLEDGADTAEKENFTQLAARQQKFIQQLENALARIKNGTYGICVDTGKLIPKERLRAVPHTQHSIEAKLNRKD
jgi:DnaK suppressor protein